MIVESKVLTKGKFRIIRDKKVIKKEKKADSEEKVEKKSAKKAKKEAKKTKKREPISGKKLLKGTIRVGSVVLVVFLFVFLGYCRYTLPTISQKATRAPKLIILSANKTEIASYGSQYGKTVNLKQLPPFVYQSIISTEDIRFYSHFGIDMRSVFRALYTNMIKRKKAQGASTITQQVAKNLFLTSEKTIKRKIQEVMLALTLERELTKDQILTIYLNRVYFGSGTYGIDAAAHKYYGVSAENLSLYQAAVLAGILKAPTSLNPLKYPERANKRARIVLANMVKAGYISATTGLHAAENGNRSNINREKSVLYFTDWVADIVDSYLGSADQDIIIETTLDSTLQAILTAEIQKQVSDTDLQAAGVIMSYNGAVLAMVGGKDYITSPFNRATEASRQIGSVMKPFVYLTAFENGAKADDKIEDKPVHINGWSPRNATHGYYGTVTLHSALKQSLNTVAVQIGLKTGIKKVAKLAGKFGIIDKSCEITGPMILGACQSSPLNVTASYAEIANGGAGVVPYGITQIKTTEGQVLYSRIPNSRPRLVEKESLDQLKPILFDIVETGTGKKAHTSIASFGKTGTTQDNRDAWFAGFTDEFSMAIWVGKDDNTPMEDVSGGGMPAEIWGNVVSSYYLD